MTTPLNDVGTCDFETGCDEDTGVIDVCGRPAVCEVWFYGDILPEARFCERHRPEVRELT